MSLARTYTGHKTYCIRDERRERWTVYRAWLVQADGTLMRGVTAASPRTLRTRLTRLGYQEVADPGVGAQTVGRTLGSPDVAVEVRAI